MSTMAERRKLSLDKLRWTCDDSCFDFDSTLSVPGLTDIIGQPRAIESLEFGLKIESHGYNIFAAGLTGTGRMTLIKTHLEELVKFAPEPEDICVVYNFADADTPHVLILPTGKGCDLRRDVDQLVGTLQEDVPRAFESKEYESEVSGIAQVSQTRQQEMLGALESFASERAYSIEFTKIGITLQPVKDGEPMDAEFIAGLPEEEKKVLEERREEVQNQVQRFLKSAKELNRETRDKIEAIKQRMGVFVVGSAVDILKENYADFPEVMAYLKAFQEHAVENLGDFGEEEEKQPQMPFMPARTEPEVDKLNKYRINVLVDNSKTQGAPVVIETSPSYYNLFGRIERKSVMGALFTNFMMIKTGAILKARGGYLVINAMDALVNPGVWENLKKVVKYEEVRIEDLGEQYSLFPLSSMKPQPIPTKLKIIMIGDNRLYHMLQSHDPDFREIFKVKVDFDSQMPKKMAVAEYPAFISTRVRQESLIHFAKSGVAAMIEEGARQVDDQEWTSTRFARVADIVREASFWAKEDGAKLVEREHVDKALEKKRFRSNLIEERIQRLYDEGTIMVDVDGMRVGQVNGLAVLDLGDIRFGKPSKITAKTWMGRAGIVDIEREAKMAGRSYQKGVLIISGYLGSKYAQGQPLTLSSTLAFEQSYDGIDGDSASSTELYALLSSLSGVPTRQGIAITGSVNQHGDVQPIGGVNEKIEGYFAICKMKGLTGDQGVMMPASNERNLMLSGEVREAVAAGQFHIWSVESIDQGLEILTGRDPGEMNAEGEYPEDSIHALVLAKLDDYRQGLTGEKDDDDEKDEKDQAEKPVS